MAPRRFPTPLLGLLILAALLFAAFSLPAVSAKDQSGQHGEKGHQNNGDGDHQGAGKSHIDGKNNAAAVRPPPPPGSSVAPESGSSVQAAPAPAESPVVYHAVV